MSAWRLDSALLLQRRTNLASLDLLLLPIHECYFASEPSFHQDRKGVKASRTNHTNSARAHWMISEMAAPAGLRSTVSKTADNECVMGIIKQKDDRQGLQSHTRRSGKQPWQMV
jgi:hypothetical protein